MRHPLALLSSSLLLLVVVSATSLSAQDQDGTYGYVRVLEGRATVTESQTGEESEAEEQLPLLSGDVFHVHLSSRLEAVLADRSRIRLDENTTIELLSLAGSADSQATETAMRLEAGGLHYVVVDPPPAERAPVVETESAQFFLQDGARALIAIESLDSTRLTVRRGYVEVVTSRGSSLVRAQEQALISGGRWATVAIAIATAIYVLVSLFMLLSMHNSLRLNKQIFESALCKMKFFISNFLLWITYVDTSLKLSLPFFYFPF